MEPGLINQGLTLMLVGMGTVFVFLTALVGAMSIMSAAVGRYHPPPGGDQPSSEEVAAIGAAIRRHRDR